MTTADSEHRELIDGTLAWCNEIRRDRGQPALAELPKGRRHDSESCPCGRATGVLVGSSVWAEVDEDLEALDRSDGFPTFSYEYEPVGECGETPPVVRRFVKEFDMGHLPELDEFSSLSSP